ncbi:hypothetical protein ACVW00_000602 [Marmoricola sp. URHA0025 HA25]
MKANRLVLLAVAGASMLALSGCAQSGDVAARVGDTTVPNSDVDFLTKVQCGILAKSSGSGQAQAVPRSQVRIQWVNALVEAQLNRQLAARDHLSYDRSTLRSAMDQFESTLSQAPAGDRDRARDLIESIYRGQLEVVGLAQTDFARQGVTSPSDDEVRQAVAKILADFRKKVDVEVNPQYGPDAQDAAGSVDPSLSRAVSSYARHSVESPPGQSTPMDVAQKYNTWVAGLPADQRCG